MANSKKNIFKLCIFWVFTFLLLIPDLVQADTTDIGYITDNTSVIISNNTGVDYTLPVNTANNVVPNIRTMIIQFNNQNLLKEVIYELELRTPTASFNDNINYFFIRANGTMVCRFYGMGDLTNGYPKIYFSCPNNFTYMTIGLGTISGNADITSSSNFRWNYAFLRKLDSNEDLDLGPVISNQTQNTENIINNNNQNTQQIIDNQNELLGSKCSNEWNPTLKSASTHRGITFTPVLKDGVVEKYVINGTRTSGSNAYVVMNSNITITKGTHIKVYSGSGIYAQLYDGTNAYNFTEYTATETKTWNSLAIFTTATPIDNVEYKVMISSDSSAPFCIYGSYTSKLDGVSGAIDGMTDALTDDSPISLDQISSTAGWLPAGPIDSIINLPLNFFNGLLTALNGTCQPLHVPIPYLDNKFIDIPCISTIFNQIEGLPNFWNWVGAICSVVILYRYLLSLYKYYDDLTTLKANFISDFGGAP